MTVNPDDRGIDHDVLPVWIGGDGIDHALENARFHSVTKTLEHRVPFTEPGRQVPPWTVGPHNPQPRLDKQPPVRPGSVALPGQNGGIFAHCASVKMKRSMANSFVEFATHPPWS